MESFFNINFEFNKEEIQKEIEDKIIQSSANYICVVDGNILVNVYNNNDYAKIINESLFSICDGSWTAKYINWLYGIHREPYTGSQIFQDLLSKGKYSHYFLGGSKEALEGLKKKLPHKFPSSNIYYFQDLPFKNVDEFDYKSIGEEINKLSPNIIWVGLGAPKQEWFMNKLKPFLNSGIMIGVGAVFNFYGSDNIKRAPEWLLKLKLEFLHRLLVERKKQYPKFKNYIKTLPKILIKEYKKKNGN